MRSQKATKQKRHNHLMLVSPYTEQSCPPHALDDPCALVLEEQHWAVLVLEEICQMLAGLDI